MLLEFLKFWDTESVFSGFEVPLSIMIYITKFLIYIKIELQKIGKKNKIV